MDREDPVVGGQPPPGSALVPPTRLGGDGAQVALGDGIAPARDGVQEEDRLLDVGGEEAQVHDLRQAGAGDVAEVGQLAQPLLGRQVRGGDDGSP